MGFQFGERSLAELSGVHGDLVRVVHRALELSTVDFAVHDGIRTVEQQAEYVRAGVSWTMESRHLGGYAVDLVPYVNGKLRWEWPPIYLVATAVRVAAIELAVQIRWGGAWDRRLNDLTDPLEDAVAAYVARRKRLKAKASIDGPHFELPKELYP